MSTNISLDIKSCSRQVWEDVLSKVNKAAVFIDGPSAEALHWQGGALLLFNAGAVDIKEFSSFESGDEGLRKAVFIISGPISEITRNVLQDILRASHFQYAILISSLCSAMHTIVNYGHGVDEMQAFHDLEENMLEWMGSMNYTAEVLYVPIVMAPVTPELFVLPEQHSMFPLLPSDLETLQLKSLTDPKGGGHQNISDLEYIHLPKESQLKIKLLVCSLQATLQNLNVSEDIFALGHTSRIVASELANLSWAKNRRKNAQHKASLLLVDRTLDVANAAGHHSETILDRVLQLLPRLPGHHTDVSVDMTPVCMVDSNPNFSVLAPGCLAHPDSSAATSMLQAMATHKQKECLMELNRHTVEAASRENFPLKLTGKPSRVTVEQLESHVSHFRGKTKAVRRHSGLLQLVLAAIESMKQESSAKLDSLLGVEKGLLQCLADTEAPSPLAQVTDTIQKEMNNGDQRVHTIEDIFLLLLFLFSLMEDDTDVEQMQEEHKLQSVLAGAIMAQKNNLPDFLKSIIGEQVIKEKVILIVQDLFEKLKSLSRARRHLTQFSSIFHPGNMTSPAALKPLLKSVLQEIFNPNKPELNDIIYKSTGFSNLLKSGFGLFRGSSKPRPGDHQTLIVFVVGGTTCTELRQIREAVTASKTNIQVVLGSTCLTRPADLLQGLLGHDHLHPIQV